MRLGDFLLQDVSEGREMNPMDIEVGMTYNAYLKTLDMLNQQKAEIKRLQADRNLEKRWRKDAEERAERLQTENKKLRQHLQDKWGRDSYLGHIQSENTRLRTELNNLRDYAGFSNNKGN